MTDDLAKRLDEVRYYWEETAAAFLCDAADRIETLEAALREVEKYSSPYSSQMWVQTLRKIASEALEEKKDD